METLRENVRNSPRSGAAVSFIGEVGLIDESGEIVRTWQPNHAACTIGTDSDNDVRLREGNVAGIHAQIVFGKNRTLIRSMEGQVRVNGRPIRETLIDEPTTIQCGTTRLIIVPSRFAGEGRFGGHRVSSGSVTDQAARLRSQPKSQSTARGFEILEGRVAKPFDDVVSFAESETTSPSHTNDRIATPNPETPSVTDLTQFLAALEPIQIAIAETQQGIASLQERINAAEAREPVVASQTIVPDMSDVMSRIDERIGTFTTQCESLLSNAATNFDDRFQQLGELVQRLTVDRDNETALSESKSYEAELRKQPGTYEPLAPPEPSFDPATRAATLEEDYSVARESRYEEELDQAPPAAGIEENAYFAAYEAEPYEVPAADPIHHAVDFSDEASDEPLATPFDEADSYSPPELPAWFTGNEDEASDKYASDSAVEAEYASADEPATNAESSEESAWMSARLNPIYAEDTSDWLKEVEAEQSADAPIEEPGPEVFSYAPADDSNSTDQHEQIDEPNEQAEVVDYNDYAGLNFAAEVADEDPADSVEPLASGMSSSSYTPSYESTDEASTDDVTASNSSSSRYEPTTTYDASAEASSSAIQAEPAEEVEESIEEYMQRLLQRVKGEGSDTPATKPSTKATSPVTSGPVVSKPTPAAVYTPSDDNPTTRNYSEAVTMLPQQTEASAEQDAKYAPRKSAPEKTENMAALRELANSTARSAIQKSSKKRMEMGIATKFGISMLGLAGGLILLFLNGFNANIAMLGMICSFIVCLLWGYEASAEAKKLVVANDKKPATGS